MVKVDGSNGSGLIQVRDLDKTYRRAGEDIHVLQGLNLDVSPCEFIAFMGPSGSGKTTLLNLLGGLDVPTRGSITVAGDEITHMSAGKLTEWRARHVGFVFQMYNLIPVLTAFQNVELPLLLTKLSKSDRRHLPPLRRAYWRPRPQERRRNHGAHRRARGHAPQNRSHGHARPCRCCPRQLHSAS